MRKLTTIFLAGLLLTASVLIVSATVGSAQQKEQGDRDTFGQIPISKDVVVVTSVLAGRMLDGSGVPISGVWVDCTGPSGTLGFVTGPDGAYRFNLSQTGHYVIRPHVPDSGYSPKRAAFYVIIPGAEFVHF